MSGVRITIAVDATDGPVSVDVIADPTACDCGAPTAHHPDCAAVLRLEPLHHQTRRKWWWHPNRRPTRRTREIWRAQ